MVDYDWEKHTGSGQTRCQRAVPPPCMNSDGSERKGGCPKEHPAKEKEHVLSPANRQTLEFYWQVQATHGAALTDELKQDRLLMRNLAAVHEVAEAHRRKQQHDATAALVIGAMGAKR